MNPLHIEVKERGDGLVVEFTYSLFGATPKKPECEEAVRDMLLRALVALDDGETHYEGFEPGDGEDQRRDIWLIEKGA